MNRTEDGRGATHCGSQSSEPTSQILSGWTLKYAEVWSSANRILRAHGGEIPDVDGE